MKEHKEFRVLHACADGSIQDNGGHNGTFNQLRALFTPDHGWLVADPDNLPADFSVDTYTIADGELVKASAELLAERLAAQRVAEREAIRAERERRYQSEPIASLYWTWIESGVEADRAAWIAAKEAVRLELPYPETQEGGAQ